ncbi:glycosyltransferase [Candidatus Pacearchaeota archaeon]|nr:glycosyltransferase [Candidatus Pacearchaeota archaeon]
MKKKHRKFPKVSVIIPVLNEEKIIASTLKSINLQNYPSFEVIVVDGGSSDRTVRIAQCLGARVITFAKGAEEQKNFGAINAQGDMLAFLDADTIVPSSWLRKIVNKFEEDKKLDAISGSGVPWDAPIYLKVEYLLYNLVRFILNRMPRPFQKFISSDYDLAIKKDLFLQIGGFNPSLYKEGRDDMIDLCSRIHNLKNRKAKVFLDITVSGGNMPRFKTLGFWKFNAYYLHCLEGLIYSLPKMMLWRRLTKYLFKLDQTYQQTKFKRSPNKKRNNL